MKEKPKGLYPTREEMCKQWELLAKKIYANKEHLSNQPDPSKSNKEGSLAII